MKKNKILIGCAVCALMVSSAFARDRHNERGFYIGAGAGLNMQKDSEFKAVKADSDSFVGKVITTYKDGGIGYIALGYDFGNNYRAELEFNGKRNNMDKLGRLAPVFRGGRLNQNALMVNVFRDFPVLKIVDLYVGAGVGSGKYDYSFNGKTDAAFVNYIFGKTLGVVADNKAFTVDRGSSRLSYQLMTGVAVNLINNLDLDVSYRLSSPFNKVKLEDNGNKDNSWETPAVAHSVLAGLRLNFAKAKAPKEVAVQYKTCWDGSYIVETLSCPAKVVQDSTPEARQISVYFDFDSSKLSESARHLIREAVASKGSSDIGRILIEGNADRAGSSLYNRGLSQRRARVVRNALIAIGVNSSSIVVKALGEDNPARRTADGVPESLNRRADVTIRFE